MQIFNQYSFLIIGLAGLLVLTLVLLRGGRTPGRLVVLAAVTAALVAVWLVARPTATPAADRAAIQAQLNPGQPVLLELLSPY